MCVNMRDVYMGGAAAASGDFRLVSEALEGWRVEGPSDASWEVPF